MISKVIARMCVGLTALLVTTAAWTQQAPVSADPREAAESVPAEESPIRKSPSTTDENGKSLPVASEKLVLADPDTKLYMPCRDRNDSSPSDDASKTVKLNPKAAVLSEEAAKQHGFKPSPHKVDCPKQ